MDRLQVVPAARFTLSESSIRPASHARRPALGHEPSASHSIRVVSRGLPTKLRDQYARLVPRSLRSEWEVHADECAATARTPGHDTFYWNYNEPSFLAFVPPPRGLTLDVGCGEGRLGRALLGTGHQVLGIDGSATLARLAADADPPLCCPARTVRSSAPPYGWLRALAATFASHP